MGWDDVIFNDNTPITCKTFYYYSSIKTGSFTPGELTSKYALEASSRSFMNTLANFWLIVPASGKNDGYYCVFGYTFPTDKPIDIINNYEREEIEEVEHIIKNNGN